MYETCVSYSTGESDHAQSVLWRVSAGATCVKSRAYSGVLGPIERAGMRRAGAAAVARASDDPQVRQSDRRVDGRWDRGVRRVGCSARFSPCSAGRGMGQWTCVVVDRVHCRTTSAPVVRRAAPHHGATSQDRVGWLWTTADRAHEDGGRAKGAEGGF